MGRGRLQLRIRLGWRLSTAIILLLLGVLVVCGRLSGLGGYLFDMKQPTQNWHGPGESDCLIKTKHCDVC